jgi:hypothetical protein
VSSASCVFDQLAAVRFLITRGYCRSTYANDPAERAVDWIDLTGAS